MAQHNSLGKAGEQAAIEFLIKQGYTIRETNWRLNHLEIDIVAQDSRPRLHIVEVKTRTSEEHFDPLKAINKTKIRNLVAAAAGYISHYRLHMEVQYDVMIITGSPQNFSIQYIPDAFYPPLRSFR